MPRRRANESLKSYVGRCVPIRRKEHPEESHERSVAACYGMGRKKGSGKSMKEGKTKTVGRKVKKKAFK